MIKTQEQQNIIDFVKTGKDLIIQAYAGAAKTTTLKFIAEELSDKNILYIAFNKAIVDEATKKMPSNVTVKTIHSVAYANSNKDLLQRLTYTKKLDIPAIASICKLNSMTLYNNYTRQKETFNSYRVASWALKVATSFMHSSKKDIKSEDVYLGNEYNHLILNDSDKLILSQAAKKIWLYYVNDNTYHITHDVYLKIFGMSKINLNYDIILIDECQDVSGIMLSFLNSQINSQKIYVGDQFQKIYSFTGSIDITKHLTNVTTLNLTRTFRFGENIAVYANHWIKQLNENALKLKCNDNIEIPELETHAILCRSNAAVIEEYLKIINNDSTLKCNVSCDINSITLFFNALKDIDENKKTNYPILSYFNSIKSLYDWVENNDFMLDTDFLQNIKLSKKFNYKLILPILNNYKTHKYPDIVISTVHKAKGLEWDEVTLGSDFNFKNDEELRLFYVAITRARYKLNNYKKYDISHRTVEQMRIDIGVLDPNKAKKDFKPIVQNTVKHNTNTFKSNSHNTTKYNKATRY